MAKNVINLQMNINKCPYIAVVKYLVTYVIMLMLLNQIDNLNL